MAHPEQQEFLSLIKRHFPSWFSKKRVIEIGSLNINGSVRDNFDDCDYTGVDIGKGTGVDLVKPGQLVDFPSESMDVALSCECLEHNPFWVETMSNMFRMVKPGGLVIMSCASTGRKEHGTMRTNTKSASPLTVMEGWEYYRNVSAKDVECTFNLGWWFSDYDLRSNYQSIDTYFVGLKKPVEASASFEAFRKDMKAFCSPFRSLRSTAVWLGVTLGGEVGVSVMRNSAKYTGLLRNTS